MAHLDIISQYVNLEKRGKVYIGLCPFHEETSPSFLVKPEKNKYCCLSCGKTGTIDGFQVDYESFMQTKTAYMQKNKNSEKKRALLRLNEDAAKYYHKQLSITSVGMNYLKRRHVWLSKNQMHNWGFGYASKQYDGLYRHLKGLGYSDEMIKESGLVIFKENRTYDMFRNRVMFPIFNVKHQVIGFGGRTLGDSKAKYLNSSESMIFKKRDNLFGLHLAKKTTAPYFILCEGYMDVIALHQAGFDNAIATLGTALTPEHIQVIKRYTDTVYLSYDSDGPGRDATEKAAALLKEQYIAIKVIDLHPYKDPDEFIKALGKEAYMERIERAKDVDEYLEKEQNCKDFE